MQLSVIIPTLNAAKTLAGTLAALDGCGEVLVIDGGSTDATLAIGEAHGALVIRSARGRGVQLAAGAAIARGDWLLFLHADTVLAPGWHEVVSAFALAHSTGERAAAFRFALDDSAWQARALETLVSVRAKALALPYGDQGLLIPRTLYLAIGGYRSLPIMEDVDFVRRLGRKRIVMLNHDAITSADRWRRRGWFRQSLRNQYCLALYLAGASNERIRKIYES
jgi:rSAM/selenodomain-associated transferase 2